MKQFYTHSNKNKRKGFTLVELLVYVVISATIIIVTTVSAMDVLFWKARFEVGQSIDQNNRFVTETITRAIRNAVSITVPGIGEASSTLSLITNNASTSPMLFYLENERVVMKRGISEIEFLTTDNVSIDSLVFRNVATGTNPHSIRIELVTHSSASSTRADYNKNISLITTVNAYKK